MVKAKSFFDFINVEVYTNPERYTVKQMKYWIWSELKQEYQEHEVTEALYYRDIEEYVKQGIVYIHGID